MKNEFLKIAGVKTTKAFYDKYPSEAAFFQAHPEAKHLKTMARGGSASGKQQQIMQLIQMYAKSTGVDPRQLMQQLQQMPPQQQQQAIQQMAQAVQGGGGQQQSQPTMQFGGGLNHYDVQYPQYQYGGAQKYTGVSVVDLLDSIGQHSDYKSRADLAKSFGIKNYKGSENQNASLIEEIKKRSGQNTQVSAPQTAPPMSMYHDMFSQQVAPVKAAPQTGKTQTSPNPSYPNTLPSHPIIGIPEHTTAPWENGYSQPMSNVKPVVPVTKPASKKDNKTPTPAPVPVASPIQGNPFSTYQDRPGIMSGTKDDARYLESGMIEDRNKGVMYVIQKGKVSKTFPIMTGYNKDGNSNTKSIPWLETHPEEAKKLKVTPVGTYLSTPNPDLYGKPGFNMDPIPAFGQPAPVARSLAQHVVYGTNPNPGQEGYDPKEGARRIKIMNGPGEKRTGSFGCTNMFGQDIDCLTGQIFPKGDTTIVVDSRNSKDQGLINRYLNTSYAIGGYIGSDGQRHQSTGANWSGNAFYADGGSAPLEYPHMFKYAPTYEMGPHMAYGGYMQMGGDQDADDQGQMQQAPQQQGPDPQQVMQEVAQKLQQGEQPEQIVQELVQEGVPQDQAQQIVQQVVQQMQGQQGGGGQEQQAPPQAMYGMGMKYGGIHIKKSHEGMFTAYKKRTGKTTEEALHSKDPHVRQMANFARNAAKWHHQDGGQYMQMGGPTIGQTMDVTPAQAAMLRQQGYTFDQI